MICKVFVEFKRAHAGVNNVGEASWASVNSAKELPPPCKRTRPIKQTRYDTTHERSDRQVRACWDANMGYGYSTRAQGLSHLARFCVKQRSNYTGSCLDFVCCACMFATWRTFQIHLFNFFREKLWNDQTGSCVRLALSFVVRECVEIWSSKEVLRLKQILVRAPLYYGSLSTVEIFAIMGLALFGIGIGFVFFFPILLSCIGLLGYSHLHAHRPTNHACHWRSSTFSIGPKFLRSASFRNVVKELKRAEIRFCVRQGLFPARTLLQLREMRAVCKCFPKK